MVGAKLEQRTQMIRRGPSSLEADDLHSAEELAPNNSMHREHLGL